MGTNKTMGRRDAGTKGQRDTLTIAVLTQKGGAGKTTLSTNLAAAAHLGGARTLLIDLDVQGSALDWGAARGEGSRLDGLTVMKADRALGLPRFREMSQGYGAVFFDGPPRLDPITRNAAVAADVVLVPLQASALDLWAIRQTIDVLDEADAIRAELSRAPIRRAFVLNRAIAGTGLARQVEGLPDLEILATVHQRIAFPEAAAVGESVLTREGTGAAAFEIRRLWRAIAPAARERGVA
jgi:chromosome partitioning protein